MTTIHPRNLDEAYVEDCGLVVLSDDDAAFPTAFRAGLIAEVRDDVSVYPVDVLLDDFTGDVWFVNASGDAFWCIPASVPEPYRPMLIANPWLAPSRVITRWTLVQAEDAETLLLTQFPHAKVLSHTEFAENTAFPHSTAFRWRNDPLFFISSPPRGDAPEEQGEVPALPTNLVFTAIDVSTNGVTLSLGWPTNTPQESPAIPDGVLDIYAKTNLVDSAWWLLATATGAVGATSLDIALPGTSIPGFLPNPHMHDETCPATTNVSYDVYLDALVTNVTYLCEFAIPTASAAFFRAGTRQDSDSDGLPDAYETLVLLSDPAIPQTASHDTDGDGLSDLYEYRIGTNPLSIDTDGDGLSDKEEVFGVETVHDAASHWVTFPQNAGTWVLANADDESSCVDWTWIDMGGDYARAVFVNANGLVFFAHSTNELASGHHLNGPAATIPVPEGNGVTLAAFWDDLLFTTGGGVRLLEQGETGNVDYCLFFDNARFYGGGDSDMASFQVLFRDSEPNTIHVLFGNCVGLGSGSSATLGIRTPRETLEYALNQPGAVTNGLHLVYHVGYGTNPLAADTDGDGLSDGLELWWGGDPHLPDTDGDELCDGDEYALGTDMTNPDTDGDGLSDFVEITAGLDPCWADSDDDDLWDGDELDMGTNPLDPDSDGDGILDGLEVQNALNPLLDDAGDDNDADGMPNGWEVAHGLDPQNPDDADDDPDGDGLCNRDEFLNGTDPNISDIDETMLPLPFHVYGDWAAWDMTVTAISGDTNTFHLVTDVPGAANTRTLLLRKGASYGISLLWRGSGDYVNPYWYCWEAQIGNSLVPSSQCFENYNHKVMDINCSEW